MLIVETMETYYFSQIKLNAVFQVLVLFLTGKFGKYIIKYTHL